MRAEDALAKTVIFSGLDRDDIETLARHVEELELSNGDAVFGPGEVATAMYVVVSGAVDVTRETLIARLLPGDTFGELEFFAGSARNARAAASGATTLLRFPREGETLSSVTDSEPTLAADALHAFLQFLSSRVRSALGLIKENSAVVRELARQVYGDKLTGLWNKTWLEENFPQMVRASGGRAALLLLKPDNFKQINDTFGHEAGDATLRLMAAELARRVADRGQALRYLGNEIGAVFPGAGADDAAEEAERLRRAFREMDLSDVTGDSGISITVSVGAGSCPDHDDDPAALIAMVHELPLKGRARGGDTVLFPGVAP